MPNFFGTSTELELSLQKDLDVANQQLEENRATIASQYTEIERLQQLGGIASEIEQEAAAIKAGDTAYIDPVTEAAQKVRKDYLSKIAAGVVKTVAEGMKADLIAEFGPDWTAEEVKRQRETMHANGTFEDLENTMRTEQVQAIVDGLLDDKRKEVDKKLSQPEEQARIKADAEQAAQDSAEIKKYEDVTRQEMVDACKIDSVGAAKARIDAAIEAEREPTLESYIEQC